MSASSDSRVSAEGCMHCDLAVDALGAAIWPAAEGLLAPVLLYPFGVCRGARGGGGGGGLGNQAKN